jgi:hypothetical protein
MGFAKVITILFALILHSALSYGQDSNVLLSQTDTTLENKSFFATGFLNAVNKKLTKFNNKIAKRSEKALRKFHKHELKLIKKMYAKDSVLAKAHLVEAERKYAALKNYTTSDYAQLPSDEYNAYVDSVKTFLGLVSKNRNAFKDVSDAQIEKAKAYLAKTELSIKYTDEVKKYLSTQKEALRGALKQLNIFTKFKQLEKTAYYYNEYYKEYSAVLKDKKKIEKKMMGLIMQNGKVKNFFAQNSMLASLFNLPGTGDADMSNMPVLAGLQTRASVNAIIQQRVAGAGPNAANAVKAQIQEAKTALSKLKDKLEQYGKSTDIDGQPLGFTPNKQKTKPFAKRLEYGANIQTSSGSYGYPAASDIALSIGFKLNDKSVLSLGGSYKLGLGKGWDNIKLSSEGLGIRSNIDWKLKGKFFVAGGYELNHYYNLAANAANNNFWQKAALLGLTKKYIINKKLKGNMQLLYNFLNKQNTNNQPIVFRIGYTFK